MVTLIAGRVLCRSCIRCVRHPVFGDARGGLPVRAVPVVRPNLLLPRSGGARAAGDEGPRFLDPPPGQRTRAGLGQTARRARPLPARGKTARPGDRRSLAKQSGLTRNASSCGEVGPEIGFLAALPGDLRRNAIATGRTPPYSRP